VGGQPPAAVKVGRKVRVESKVTAVLKEGKYMLALIIRLVPKIE